MRWNAFATLRNVHDTMAHDKPALERRDMARNLTDCQFLLEHWLSKSQLPRKTSQEYISLKDNAERILPGLCSTCGRRLGQET